MRDINGSKPTSFPLDEEKLSFKIPCPDRPPREKILKLGSMITNRIGLKATVDDPEYWGLDALVTDEMADVALKMGVRKPKTIEQLMKLTKMEREPLQKLLDEMAWLGLIEYNWENLDGKNPNHEKRYILPLFVPGSAEFLNMRKSQIDAHPEVAAFFERMTMLPLEKITPMVPPGGAGIGMHVIPVEKAIETEQGLREIGTDDLDLVVLENVGNLVCPAEFDTGAVKNAMILSVPEGHDKPLKYPLIFTVCDVLLINKTDVLPYFDFDMEKVIEYAHRRNPKLEIFPVSAKTGEGMDAWCDWLRKQVKDWQA